MLAATPEQPLDGFGLFGVVKETGVDDGGLADFKSKYCNYDIYRDEKLEFYEGLGNRKGKICMSPFKCFKEIFACFSAIKRLNKKKIKGNMKGEHFLQGGVILFGKDGKPKYAYEEEPYDELPVADIAAAAMAIKEED